MHINAINRIISKAEVGKDYERLRSTTNTFNATIRRPIVGIKLNKYAFFLNFLKLEKLEKTAL